MFLRSEVRSGMPRRGALGVCAVLGLMAMLGGGCRCQSGMQAFDVKVTPHLGASGDAANAPPVEVNLVGVSDEDYEKWLVYPVARYWSPRDPLRTGSKVYVMNFSHDSQEPVVLKKDDPIWSAWKEKGATHLFVVAFLPLVKDQGTADARRAEVTLDKCEWKGTSQLDFELHDDRVVSESKPGKP